MTEGADTARARALGYNSDCFDHLWVSLIVIRGVDDYTPEIVEAVSLLRSCYLYIREGGEDRACVGWERRSIKGQIPFTAVHITTPFLCLCSRMYVYAFHRLS